jgi:hypothetical protein
VQTGRVFAPLRIALIEQKFIKRIGRRRRLIFCLPPFRQIYFL